MVALKMLVQAPIEVVVQPPRARTASFSFAPPRSVSFIANTNHGKCRNPHVFVAILHDDQDAKMYQRQFEAELRLTFHLTVFFQNRPRYI